MYDPVFGCPLRAAEKRYSAQLPAGFYDCGRWSLHRSLCRLVRNGRLTVIVSDINTDPLWADYRELALAYGLQAGWSTPILSAQETVLGSFAIYSREPRSPTPQERKLLAQFAHVASVAIEHTRAQESLRRSEAKYRDLIDVSPDAIYIIGTDLTYVLANP